MADRARIPRIMEKLEALWYDRPELRFCQMLVNVLEINYDPFYITDERLEAALDQLIKYITEQ